MSNSWELVSERPGDTISGLLVVDAGVLALSTAALHLSVDSGETWTTVSVGQPTPPLYALGQTRRSLFVGGATGLWRSRDGGSTWHEVLTGAAMLSVAVATDGSLLVATESEGVLRSEDDGEEWVSGNPGLTEPNVLCLTAGAEICFAGTATGLYRSVNGGRAWREVDLGCGQPAVECLAISGGMVLAGTEDHGALLSEDRGRRWSPVCGLSELVSVTAVAIGCDGSVLVVGSADGVYVSRDGGTTWRFDSLGIVLSLALAGGYLLAGLADRGVGRLQL